MLPAGQRDPIRFRAAYVTDADIASLVATYGRPVDAAVVEGQGEEVAA